MKFQGLTLDQFQEDSIKAINRNVSVLVSSPTGSGKTLIADYIIDKYIKEGKRVIYTAPIKALSNQKFKDFCEQYGEDRIGLVTGDLVINPGGDVLIMTTEVYRNMAIINDPVLDNVQYVVFDEIHFISDEERGYIWEESIMFSPDHIRFLFLSATIPNSQEFAEWVESIKNHEVFVVRHHIRPVPLDRKFYDVELGITTLDKIKERKELDKYPDYRRGRGKMFKKARVNPPDYRELVHDLTIKGELPCIYFVFSRVKTQEYAVKLSQKKNLLNSEEQKKINTLSGSLFRKLNPEVLSLRSTQELRQCIPKGIAFHNAGMLPDIKHIVEKLFGQGLIKVLFATETFAVGINMPAKSVCFDSLRKYTGTGFRYLTSKEYFQISGRAGRRGIDKKGLSVSVIHRPSAEIDRIREFTEKDTLPLQSQFQLTYNTVLNLIDKHTMSEIQKILQMNLFTFQKIKGKSANKGGGRVLGSIKARFTKVMKTLTKLGYIETKGEESRLTKMGSFASKIFSDEVEITQMFVGHEDFEWDEYYIVLAILALVYEGKRETRFYRFYDPKKVSRLLWLVNGDMQLKRKKWGANIEKMTAIVNPLYSQKKFVDLLKNTNMPEGDLIRLLMRVLDKLEQIDRAIVNDSSDGDKLQQMVRNCKHLIKNSLEGIHVF